MVGIHLGRMCSRLRGNICPRIYLRFSRKLQRGCSFSDPLRLCSRSVLIFSYFVPHQLHLSLCVVLNRLICVVESFSFNVKCILHLLIADGAPECIRVCFRRVCFTWLVQKLTNTLVQTRTTPPQRLKQHSVSRVSGDVQNIRFWGFSGKKKKNLSPDNWRCNPPPSHWYRLVDESSCQFVFVLMLECVLTCYGDNNKLTATFTASLFFFYAPNFLSVMPFILCISPVWSKH